MTLSCLYPSKGKGHSLFLGYNRLLKRGTRHHERGNRQVTLTLARTYRKQIP